MGWQCGQLHESVEFATERSFEGSNPSPSTMERQEEKYWIFRYKEFDPKTGTVVKKEKRIEKISQEEWDKIKKKRIKNDKKINKGKQENTDYPCMGQH